jgi:hypothetical protein
MNILYLRVTELQYHLSFLTLRKQVVAQLMKIFPVIYGNQKFITVFKESATGSYPDPVHM